MKECGWFLIFCLLSGCTTVGDINKSYNAIDLTDGIDQSEAQATAQKSLASSSSKGKYAIGSPQVLDHSMTRQYKGYWFVSFDARAFEMAFWKYLVVVDQNNGSILFEGPYQPLKTMDYDWVFKRKPLNGTRESNGTHHGP